jgi:hypothetical protein
MKHRAYMERIVALIVALIIARFVHDRPRESALTLGVDLLTWDRMLAPLNFHIMHGNSNSSMELDAEQRCRHHSCFVGSELGTAYI